MIECQVTHIVHRSFLVHEICLPEPSPTPVRPASLRFRQVFEKFSRTQRFLSSSGFWTEKSAPIHISQRIHPTELCFIQHKKKIKTIFMLKKSAQRKINHFIGKFITQRMNYFLFIFRLIETSISIRCVYISSIPIELLFMK